MITCTAMLGERMNGCGEYDEWLWALPPGEIEEGKSGYGESRLVLNQMRCNAAAERLKYVSQLGS